MRIEEKKNKIILKTVDVGSWPHALATLALLPQHKECLHRRIIAVFDIRINHYNDTKQNGQATNIQDVT